MSLKSIWQRRATQRHLFKSLHINVVIDPAMPKDMVALVPQSFKTLKLMAPMTREAALKLIGRPILYAPKKSVVLINIADEDVEVK